MLFVGETYTETFPARAEAVPAARMAVSEFAALAGANGERLDAICLAASEAVTNAVLHAYPPVAERAGTGAVQVSASYVEDEVWILVADRGDGLRSERQSTGLGLGLALIAQLADDFQIVSRGGGGTELRMRFKLRAADRAVDPQPRGSAWAAIVPA